MRAVDTNILARFYLRDDTTQGRIAADVLTAGDVFIPKTVVLELEWVLRYVAAQPGDKVTECLAHLIALPGVTVEDRDEIEAALGHCRNRIDLADALHLEARAPWHCVCPLAAYISLSAVRPATVRKCSGSLRFCNSR